MKHYSLYKHLSLVVMCSLFTYSKGQANLEKAHISSQENRQEVEALVQDAARYFSQESPNVACADFAFGSRWRRPHTKLFVIDEQDLVWFMDDCQHIWTHLEGLSPTARHVLIRRIRQVGQRGGWVVFIWNQALAHTYVRNVVNKGRTFSIGAITFIENPYNEVQEHIYKAMTTLKRKGIPFAIEQINNPGGRFLKGSFSIAMYNNKGICVADSFDITRVGLQVLSWKDDEGNPVFQDYLDVTEHAHFGWVKHVFNTMREHTFVARFTVSPGEFYILTSGYYPQVNDQFVIDFAHQVRDYIVRHGGEKSFDELSKGSGEFNKGRLFLVVYDTKGVVKLHTKYPSLRGVDAYNHRDQAGYSVTQEILRQVATYGSAWVFYYISNAAELVYAQKLILPEGTFILTVQGYTPLTRPHLSAGMAEWVCQRMLIEPVTNIFKALNRGQAIWNQGFTGPGHGHVYGDFFIEIYDEQGFCVSAASRHERMWRLIDASFLRSVRMLSKRDDRGAWFSDRGVMWRPNEIVQRFYYIRPCRRGPREIYYIFVGYSVP